MMKYDGKLREEIAFILSLKENDWKSKNPFNQYLHMAEISNERGDRGNRFDKKHLVPLKNFCTYLYLKCGSSGYNAIASNSVMPSIKTVQNEIYNLKKMEIGSFYIENFVEELQDIYGEDCKKIEEILIAEDGTKLSDDVSYDPVTDQIYGLVPEHNIVIGLPREKFFKASTPSKVIEDIKNCKIASYLQVITAKPMIFGNLHKYFP